MMEKLAGFRDPVGARVATLCFFTRVIFTTWLLDVSFDHARSNDLVVRLGNARHVF
jgi:hypothetical protein